MIDSSGLSDLQLAVMSVLWKQREATAAEVHAALADRELAITTISTILTRLERRDVVAHRSEGRLYIYRAAISEPEVRQSMLGSLVDSLFSGDPAEVVSQLLARRDLSVGDLDRMRALIEASQKHGAKRRG